MPNQLYFSCIHILINLTISFVISYLINVLHYNYPLTNYSDSIIFKKFL